VHVMKPVSIAMDLLQSEQECCIGHVIPTIMGIQQKLKSMTVDPAVNPLVTALRMAWQQDSKTYLMMTATILPLCLFPNSSYDTYQRKTDNSRN